MDDPFNPIPVFGCGNQSTMAPEGNPMILLVAPTSADVIDPSRGLLHNGQVDNAVFEERLQNLRNPLLDAM